MHCGHAAQEINQFHKYFRKEWVVKGVPEPKDEIDPLESESIWKKPVRSYPYYFVLYDAPNGKIIVMAKYLNGRKLYDYSFSYDDLSKTVVKVSIYTPGKGEAVFYEKK